MKIVIFGRRCAPDEHWKLRKYTKNCMKMKVFGIWWALEIKEIYKKLHENCNFWDLMCAWCAFEIKEKYKKLHENDSFWYQIRSDWYLRRSHFWYFSANRVAPAGSDVKLGLRFINFKKLNLIRVLGLGFTSRRESLDRSGGRAVEHCPTRPPSIMRYQE